MQILCWDYTAIVPLGYSAIMVMCYCAIVQLCNVQLVLYYNSAIKMWDYTTIVPFVYGGPGAIMVLCNYGNMQIGNYGMVVICN